MRRQPRRSTQSLDDMGKLIVAIAFGAVTTFAVFLLATYFDMHLSPLREAGEVVVEDPYRLRRQIGQAPESIAYATAILVYVFLPFAMLFDRIGLLRTAPAARSVMLTSAVWLVVVGFSMVEVGPSTSLVFLLGTLVAFPLFCGSYVMFRVMSSNKSLERTRER
jgi:hypothetical protein